MSESINSPYSQAWACCKILGGYLVQEFHLFLILISIVSKISQLVVL